MTQEKIGEIYGVHQTVIGKILRRDLWFHI